MLPDTAAQWHAALNDFPSLLFVLAVLFDILGEATKRDSLRATGFWLLVTGAFGAVLALISGLMAEESIEHGGSVHMVMERHETMAIWATVLFVLLAAWRIWRRGALGPRERPAFTTISALGALFVLWTAHVGGTIVYGYGGGVPTSVLQGALEERTTGHSHAPGEEHDEAATDSTAEEEHTDPPGTPEHEHE
jgi:uncharacterized membrane protein